MGNHLATPARPAPAIDLVAEVPNVVFKEALGASGWGWGGVVGWWAWRAGRGHARPDAPPHPRLSPPGGGRLLKSMLCIHDDAGLVVVKAGGMGGGAGRPGAGARPPARLPPTLCPRLHPASPPLVRSTKRGGTPAP